MILADVCKIIQTYMELSDSQIWLKNEKIGLPKGESLCVSVGFMGNLKVVGSKRENTGDQETISNTFEASVTIDIFGRDFDVIERKDEIPMAMASAFSRDYQTKTGIYISRDPVSFNNISGIDGAAIPYRFQYVFRVQFIKSITKTVSYYDTFEEVETLTE